jgi:hypothetical protein
MQWRKMYKKSTITTDAQLDAQIAYLTKRLEAKKQVSI